MCSPKKWKFLKNHQTNLIMLPIFKFLLEPSKNAFKNRYYTCFQWNAVIRPIFSWWIWIINSLRFLGFLPAVAPAATIAEFISSRSKKLSQSMMIRFHLPNPPKWLPQFSIYWSAKFLFPCQTIPTTARHVCDMFMIKVPCLLCFQAVVLICNADLAYDAKYQCPL